MKGYFGVLAHFDALPALIGTVPDWNSTLAIWVMAIVAVSTYILIGRAIDDEVRGA